MSFEQFKEAYWNIGRDNAIRIALWSNVPRAQVELWSLSPRLKPEYWGR